MNALAAKLKALRNWWMKGPLFYRHGFPVRLSHWINALCILFLFMSGLQIFNAHPALYWGATSHFDTPIFSMTAKYCGESICGVTQIGSLRFDSTGLFGASSEEGVMVVRGFPDWLTLPGIRWLAMGRLWHFFFAWIFAVNFVLFAVYAIWSRHLKRDLLPTKADIQHLPREIADHARLRFPKGEATKRYNALQKLTYFIVLFVLIPLTIITGLTMSPTLNAAFPQMLWIFGGRQSARTIHFLCAFSFLGFFIVHIVMVLLTGPLNNLRSIVTGWTRVPEGKDA